MSIQSATMCELRHSTQTECLYIPSRREEELNLCLNAKRVFNVISSFAGQNILNQLDENPIILFPLFSNFKETTVRDFRFNL